MHWFWYLLYLRCCGSVPKSHEVHITELSIGVALQSYQINVGYCVEMTKEDFHENFKGHKNDWHECSIISKQVDKR